jgi:uncharacterized protein
MEKECKCTLPQGVFIMVGLVVVGICFIVAISKFKSYDRFVSVKGLCEKEVPANKVIWPIAYKSLGNDLIAIYQDINSKNSLIISFLRENGVAEGDISVSAPNVIDMQANQYSENKSPYRYGVTSVITVSTEKVGVVRACIAKQIELLKRGIALAGDEYTYQVQYAFTGLNDIKPQMIEEATKNARAAADKFAKDSRSKLGRIKSANQGQFSVEDRDNHTPYIKKVRVVTSVDYYLR